MFVSRSDYKWERGRGVMASQVYLGFDDIL